MKKMLVLLAATALFTTAAAAQTTPAATTAPGQGRMQDAARSPEQCAEMRTKRLTQQLGLSADQSAKVREIVLAETRELQALRGQYASAGSRQGAGQELKAVQEKYDAQLKGIFSSEQYTRYLQLRDEQLDKRKEKMKEGKLKRKG